MTRNEIIAYCQNEYNATADKPFKHYSDYLAIRHPNGKWFGLIMNVPVNKLELSGTEELDILDLKVDPELNSILQLQAGFLPGYHMSKEHWLSVILSHFENVDQLADLIDGSYNLTAK